MRTVLAVLFVATAALAQTSTPAVPQTLVHSGRLFDASGKAMSGPQTLTFSLFPEAVMPAPGETPVWTETYSVLLDADGLYTVELGGPDDSGGATNKIPFNDVAFAPGAPRYLEIAVNHETLSPRLHVASAPYAMQAGNAAQLGAHDPAYFETADDAATKQLALKPHGSLHVAGADLTIDTASATVSGALAASDFATFNAKQGAVSAQTPLSLDPSSGQLAIATASAAGPGALSAADWMTFNNKQGALTPSGPVTLDGTGKLGFTSAAFIANAHGAGQQTSAAINIDGPVAAASVTAAGAVTGNSVTAAGVGAFGGAVTASSLAASAATTNTQGLLVGSGTKLIYAVANLGPGGYSDVSQAGDSGLFAEPGTGSGANGFVIGLHAGGASTAALRIAPDGSVNASGALTGKSFNGVGLGASAVVGLYQDSTNSAVRTPGGNFYVQNAGGVKTALIAGPTAVANGPGLHVIGQLVVDDVIHVPTAIRGGNGAGNLHIDSNENAGGDGHIYLDYYSGTGVIFGAANGSGRVGSVDTAGNAGFNGTVTAGNFSGPLNGLQIWVKGGDNGTASCQNYCANVLSWPDAHGSGTCIGESNANLADGTYYSCGAAPGISVRCICAR